ncbi:hypothetical protein [Stakelama tenebrarum]|uniref:Uncharacterized protein n=1 Tax=Stakelama tenebrarum TaxID=2711215 RepID=A0A6G6Y8R3_9SPHN|nr:hypothetical protein [Sphingosinithalassobacter tenebrarum]QIG80963.1 hypothetical protein G5C33_14985 [Sphingosinithalassobacter tenebrarum]
MTGAASVPASGASAAAARPVQARRDSVRAFRWLLVGALAYAVALATAIGVNADPANILAPVVSPSVLLTPVFGMPWVVMSFHRRGRIRRAVYFLLIVTLAHMAANYLAWLHATESYRFVTDGHAFERHMLTGAIGGAVGSALSFAFLVPLRLAPNRRSSFWFAFWGTIALTAIGSWGMAWGLEWTDPMVPQHDTEKLVLWFLCVHLPWQIIFAMFLAAMMRIPAKRRRKKREPEQGR